MINILYFSTLCSEKEFDNLLQCSYSRLSQQMQKYNIVLAKGFANIENVSIFAISARPVTSSSHNQKMYKRKEETESKVNYIYLPFFNIKLLKSIFIILGAIINGIKLGIKRKQEKCGIVCDMLNIPLTVSCLIVGKILSIPVVGIITDVPGIFASDESRVSFKRRILIKLHMKLIQQSDSFVFLSKYMRSIIDKDDKPFCVIEGQVDSEMLLVENFLDCKQDKYIVMYAGSVNKENGVDILVKAFIRANVINSELHIYGGGTYSNTLKTIEARNERIKYFGTVSNQEIVTKEIEADLLVNPRPTNREFVKYSFPSKNMEYMVSGTPVLTTRIPSMPKEYNNYVYFIEDESEEGVTKAIEKILGKNKDELHHMGLRAKKFVLKEKNNIIQAKKIIDMILNTKKGINLS